MDTDKAKKTRYEELVNWFRRLPHEKMIRTNRVFSLEEREKINEKDLLYKEIKGEYYTIHHSWYQRCCEYCDAEPTRYGAVDGQYKTLEDAIRDAEEYITKGHVVYSIDNNCDYKKSYIKEKDKWINENEFLNTCSREDALRIIHRYTRFT